MSTVSSCTVVSEIPETSLVFSRAPSVSAFISNVEKGETYCFKGVEPSMQCYDLLIKYCKRFSLPMDKYSLLIKEDESTSTWKLASPSTRLSDCIFKNSGCMLTQSPFTEFEQCVYFNIVQKTDVHKYVSWNKCTSTKFAPRRPKSGPGSHSEKPDVIAGGAFL